MRSCTNVQNLMQIPGVTQDIARRIHGIWTGKHWHRWTFKADYAVARAEIAKLLELRQQYLGYYHTKALEGEVYYLQRGRPDLPTVVFIGSKIKVASVQEIMDTGHLKLPDDKSLRFAA